MTSQIKGSAMNRLLIVSPIVDGRATSQACAQSPDPAVPEPARAGSAPPNAADRRGRQQGPRHQAIQGWLGHRSITSTALYTALAPNRFKDFWRDWSKVKIASGGIKPVDK
jgi:hypothetical protein